MRTLAALDCPALPVAGGLLDQPEWLMDDLAIISSWYEARTREEDPKNVR